MSHPRQVVVVGAGVIGCAVAFELARRGSAVHVVDDRPIGGGATHASAGMLVPFSEAHDDNPLLELTLRSLELFDDFIADLQSVSGIQVRYCRSGSLDVALDARRAKELEVLAAMLGRRGVAVELLDAPGVRRAEPEVVAHASGGLLIPRHGYVSAMDMTRALATGARRYGAILNEERRVTQIFTSGPALVVETNRGDLRGDAVVLAAGCWAGHVPIAGLSARLPVRPVRGQLVELAWPGRRLRRVIWGQGCYLVPWDDGTLLVGATVEEAGFDERTTAKGVAELLTGARETVAAVADATFVDVRAGLRPGTPDDLPIIGRSRAVEHLVYATGHYRNGILLAPLTARLVADDLLEGRRDPLLDLTDPGRFGSL